MARGTRCSAPYPAQRSLPWGHCWRWGLACKELMQGTSAFFLFGCGWVWWGISQGLARTPFLCCSPNARSAPGLQSTRTSQWVCRNGDCHCAGNTKGKEMQHTTDEQHLMIRGPLALCYATHIRWWRAPPKAPVKPAGAASGYDATGAVCCHGDHWDTCFTLDPETAGVLPQSPLTQTRMDTSNVGRQEQVIHADAQKRSPPWSM